MTSPLVCVIDANVALKLFFSQPLSEVAEELFAYFDKVPGTRFFVPDFFYAECASVFASYARLMKYTDEEAREDMIALQALSIEMVSTSELVFSALEIALSHRISGYDACYVALAVQLNAPLITADEKLVQALKSKGLPVQALASFTLPPIA